MKEPKKDTERLSALLDGRVSGREREELLAQLAASDDDFEVYSDTVEILMAVEEEEARAAAAVKGGVIPLRRPGRGPRLPLRSLALAASIAAIALVSTLTLRGRSSDAGGPVQLAERLDPGGLPTGWNRTPWTADRGPGSTSPSEDAVRAGVMLVQLAVAAQARDSGATHDLASQLNGRYEGGRPGTALRGIEDRPGAPPDSLTALVGRATDDLLRVLERKPLEVGAWTEAARIAANRHDEVFFRGRATGRMLRRAERLAGDNAAGRAAVDRVRTLLPAATGPQRWNELEQSLGALLATIAS